jgi:membrane-associated phospholipid phosphatase
MPTRPKPQDRPATRVALLRARIFDDRWRHRLLLIATLLALLSVAGLAILAQLYTLLPLDVWVTQEIQELQGALVWQVMYAVSLAGYMPWSALTVAAGVALVSLLLTWRDGLYLLLITASQGLLNVLIKRTIGRPRPLETLIEVFAPVTGFSFPSGHVMFYTVFFGFLLFLALTRLRYVWLRWLIGTPLAAQVLLVGPSRIILGAHWLTDVLAAYLLGLVILALAVEGHFHYVAPAALNTESRRSSAQHEG